MHRVTFGNMFFSLIHSLHCISANATAGLLRTNS